MMQVQPRANERASGAARSVIGLAFALGLPCLPLSSWENEFASVAHLVGYEFIWWTMVTLLLLFVVYAERRALSSIGFRRLGTKNVLLAVGAGIATLVSLSAVYYALFPLLHVSETPQVNQLLAAPLWWRVLSVIRGAVGEEILFRGYAVERLEELTGRTTLAGVISCTVFALAHVGQWGWAHLLVAGVGGAIFTLLYIWRRNIWINAIAHLIVDGVGLLAVR